jgi:hypothetical protein
MVTRVAIVILFVAACFLLYYGGTMLLFVPAHPGEGYFTIGRLLYGALPFVTGLVLPIGVGWLRSRHNSSSGLLRSVSGAYTWAAGLVVLFWIALMIVAGIRQH